MKKLWVLLGRICYFLAWPALFLFLNNSQRTRVIVFYDGQLLVVKDWLGDDSWKLPGGGIHKSEDPLIGAQRELREETGIQVDSSKIKPLGIIEIEKRKVKNKLHVYGVVLADNSTILTPGYDIVEIKWLTIEQIDATKISHSTRMILDKFGRLVLS